MDTQLIVRIIVSIIAVINLCAAQFGFNPLNIEEESVYTAVSLVVAIVTWIWGFWKNNNFTKNAKIAQDFKNELDNHCKENDIEKFFEK